MAARIELVLETPDLLFQHLVVGLQLTDAGFGGLEVVDAVVGAPDRRGGARPEGPSLEDVPPGEIVLFDQIVCRLGGGSSFPGMLRAEQAQNTVEPDDVFLLNCGLPL